MNMGGLGVDRGPLASFLAVFRQGGLQCLTVRVRLQQPEGLDSLDSEFSLIQCHYSEASVLPLATVLTFQAGVWCC